MSGFTLFIVFITAAMATWQIFHNPATDVMKKWAGKKPSEVTDEMKESWEAKSRDEKINVAITEGCRWGCFIGGGLFISYILEPWLIISALASHTGIPLLGYVALLALVLSIINARRAGKKVADTPLMVKTEEGTLVEGTLVNEKPIEYPKSVTFDRIIEVIPAVYLWYIFLIGIGIIGPAATVAAR